MTSWPPGLIVVIQWVSTVLLAVIEVDGGTEFLPAVSFSECSRKCVTRKILRCHLFCWCSSKGSTPDSCSVSLLTSLNARSWTGYKQPGLGVLLALAIICSAHHGTHVSPADIQDGSIAEWCRCQVEHGLRHLFRLPQPAQRNPPALQFQLLRRPAIRPEFLRVPLHQRFHQRRPRHARRNRAD